MAKLKRRIKRIARDPGVQAAAIGLFEAAASVNKTRARLPVYKPKKLKI